MRRKLVRQLDQPLPAAPDDKGSRALRPSDAEALAVLMFSAYRGTVDDAGEGPSEARAEVDRLLGGGYGGVDFAASEVIERDGRVVCATLVTVYEGYPLVAFSMTDRDWKRRGLARGGLLRAMHRLRAGGATKVQLAVTAGNTPAENLYEALGFVG